MSIVLRQRPRKSLALHCLLLAMLSVLAALPALAQKFPWKPVRLIAARCQVLPFACSSVFFNLSSSRCARTMA